MRDPALLREALAGRGVTGLVCRPSVRWQTASCTAPAQQRTLSDFSDPDDVTDVDAESRYRTVEGGIAEGVDAAVRSRQ